ncbi:FlgO family outer membrane protein [Aliidiomarina sp. Khilg15.8]
MVSLHKVLAITAALSLSALLSACSQTPANAGPQELQRHTEALASQLFANGLQPTRVAVGSLLPVQNLQQTGHGDDRRMAQQIQEGLISAASQQGAQITEYRTTRALRLQDEQEIMLSRELDQLARHQQIDYFLTGTYSEVDGGLMVNARLILLRDSSVYAAATHYFPWSALRGATTHSELRHGALYRQTPAGASE